MASLTFLKSAGTAVATARVFSLMCAAVQLPLLTQYLSPGEYAVVAVAIAAAAYFMLIGAEPWILGFQRFPGSTENRANYTFTSIRTGATVLLFSLIALAASVPLNRELEVLALTGWGVGLAVNRLVSCAWLMWHEPWKYAQNLMIGTGARSTTLFILVLVGLNPLISLAVAGVVSAVAALIVSPRLTGVRQSLSASPWPFRFGLGLAVASASYTVLTNSTLILLSPLVPLKDLATFAAMSQVATLSSGAILGLVGTVVYPRMRSAWDDGRETDVRRSATIFQLWCLAVAYLAIGLATIGNSAIIKLMVPDSYADPDVVGVLILGLAFGSMGQTSSWLLQFRLNVRSVLVITMGAAAVSTLGAVLLGREFGLTGGTLAFCSGFLLYFVVMDRMAANSWVMSIVAGASFIALSSAAALSGTSALGPFAIIVGLVLVLSARKRSHNEQRSL